MFITVEQLFLIFRKILGVPIFIERDIEKFKKQSRNTQRKEEAKIKKEEVRTKEKEEAKIKKEKEKEEVKIKKEEARTKEKEEARTKKLKAIELFEKNLLEFISKYGKKTRLDFLEFETLEIFELFDKFENEYYPQGYSEFFNKGIFSDDDLDRLDYETRNLHSNLNYPVYPLSQCANHFGLANILRILNRIPKNYFESNNFYSFGSGNGYLEKLLSLNGYPNIMGIDPLVADHNVAYSSKMGIYQFPHYSFVKDVPTDQISGALMINWSYPDYNEYHDLQAIKILNPEFIIILWELDGIAGSHKLHLFVDSIKEKDEEKNDEKDETNDENDEKVEKLGRNYKIIHEMNLNVYFDNIYMKGMYQIVLLCDETFTKYHKIIETFNNINLIK